MTLTPENERDFETVREELGVVRVLDRRGPISASRIEDALSRLRSDLEAAREMSDWSHDRAMEQAMDAGELERRLEDARAELESERIEHTRTLELEDEKQAEVERLRAALERIADRLDVADDYAEAVDDVYDIARQALSRQTEEVR